MRKLKANLYLTISAIIVAIVSFFTDVTLFVLFLTNAIPGVDCLIGLMSFIILDLIMVTAMNASAIRDLKKKDLLP